MNDIAKLYEEVMAGAGTEKVAADMSETEQGVEFDAEFFTKVASGDEDATMELAAFIDDARANGYDDDAIEAALAEAMAEAGVEKQAADEGEEIEDGFEHEKVAAYHEGFAKAIEDGLEKAASLGVTEDDIVEYELGLAYGGGYAEGRQYLNDAVEKIAGAKMEAAKGMANKALGAIKARGAAAGDAVKTYFAGGDAKRMAAKHLAAGPTGSYTAQEKKQLLSAMKTKAERIGKRRKLVAGLAAGTVAAGGIGGAGYMAGKK